MMSSKVSGKINCKECKKEIEWYCIYGNPNRSGLYEVNVLDENKVGAKLFSGKSEPKPHEYGLYCPEDDCGVYNIFSYPEEDLTLRERENEK